jgi:hypothetical protein
MALKIIFVDVDGGRCDGGGCRRRGGGSRGLPGLLGFLHLFKLGFCIPPLFPGDEVVEGFFDVVGFELVEELFLFFLSFNIGVREGFDLEACFCKFSFQGLCLASDVTEVEEVVGGGGFPGVLDVLESVLHLFWVQEEASKLRSGRDDGEGVIVVRGEARVEQGGGDGRHLG